MYWPTLKVDSGTLITNESILQRGCRTMQGVVEQYDAANRPRLQYIFYGLLFYQSKLVDVATPAVARPFSYIYPLSL